VSAFATVNVVAIPVTLIAQHAERSHILLFSKVFALYNVLALIVLVHFLGIFGAALATGSSDMLKNLFVWWHVRHRARWTNGGAVVLWALIVWGGMVALGYALKAAFDVPAVVHLVAGVILCAAGALIFIRSPALSTSDREVLGSVLHGREARALQWLGILGKRLPSSGSAQ
jgi:hypothetical protein